MSGVKQKKHHVKTRLHIRNRNRNKYDLFALMNATPELANYVQPNKYGEDSVNFSNPAAVKMLNTAILNHYYGIKNWNFPDQNLCPPIPGRADYIHHIADLLGENHEENPPKGEKITCLDVGVGASCIYPIIGVTEYDWNFIGSDTDKKSISSAKNIVKFNTSLKNKIECRLQKNETDFFFGVLEEDEMIDLSICNPPFHSSAELAKKGSRRKIKNLTGNEEKDPKLNFSGIASELIYDGGEYKFIHRMITESADFAKNCYWFSSLVSKQANLKGLYKALEKAEAVQVRTIPMGTGNKSSRIIAWTFLSNDEQENWREERWSL